MDIYWEEENLITSDDCGWARTWHLKQFSLYVKHRPQRQGNQTRAGTSSFFSEIQHNWKLICSHPDHISRRFLCLHFQKTDQSAQDGLRLRPYMATHTSFGHVTSFSPFYHSRCFEWIKILKYEHSMSLWLSGITKSQLPKANWLFHIRSKYAFYQLSSLYGLH